MDELELLKNTKNYGKIHHRPPLQKNDLNICMLMVVIKQPTTIFITTIVVYCDFDYIYL